ncbi:hypothetical protein C0993_006041 [Termitomyces sp. T159_Od127]|nr:hypothetical protein C0993_006041 [Termitomyces sp. T159_Od127]
MAQRRLKHILQELTPLPESVGTLKLGNITYEVPAALTPSRLPRSKDLLDINDAVNRDNLHFLLQKHLLGQDVFLVSQPGPYARRLALTFASLINAEYEYIALHRDVGETELKQIRKGGNLIYVDSPAVSAVKHGRLLILEGIEKAERGIMPVLNNLLENREMNLDDGTHIIHPQRYAQLEASNSISVGGGHNFVPAHKNFRVIAIAAPVPPYPGYPLDPPFRSRFQSRFVDPVGSLTALRVAALQSTPLNSLYTKLRDLILSTQLASESRHALEAISHSSLPPFPQTALVKLGGLIAAFPPPATGLTSSQLARLLLTIHPSLVYASFQAWALLSRQTEEAGLGALESPSMSQDEDIGLMGYRVSDIKRLDETSAEVTFAHSGAPPVVLRVPAGTKTLRPFPFAGDLEFYPTRRFLGLLTCFMQAHALGWDISLIPPAIPSTASTSTSTLVKVFGQVLGYEQEVIHMYKELGGRELVMRRKIQDGGATTWEPSPLIEGAWAGQLVHLSGLDVIGSTAGSVARLIQDREIELWENKRILAEGELSLTHPSFRIISTASKSLPLKDWLRDEHANMFFPIPSQPMSREEELDILLATGCPRPIVESLLSFAEKYRQSMSDDNVLKNRKLGTRSLVRIARRLARFPQDDDLHAIISRSLLAEFLPTVEKINLDTLLAEVKIEPKPPLLNADPVVKEKALIFSASKPLADDTFQVSIPMFKPSQDVDGVVSHVPHMDHFYDNSLQSGLMRDLAIDLELLGEHVVLLGNQGVGKNKIVDRLCQLLRRPREYIQLHRDTTVNQLMFTTSLEAGILQYTDSPLLRAITYGRVIIIDEADKAPEHVVAIFRSLAGQGELTLSDGRRVRPVRERESDIVVHPNFRLVLLANRPGYRECSIVWPFALASHTRTAFLGNHFLQVLGENFSAHSVNNPDQASERMLLQQLAPEVDEDTILRLVGAFHDLRHGYDTGVLNYPYSLRGETEANIKRVSELINLIRHMRAYPQDSLGDALRNIFDFDIYKPETIDKLDEILEHHGLQVPHLGLDAARKATKKKIKDIEFEPSKTDLGQPKEGKHDDKEHSGGNTYAGGTGGRDTAGMGGRGGYKRLWKGGDIKQVPEALKDNVPNHIKEKAREMAREELKRRLEELDMSFSEAKAYGTILTATQAHMLSLYNLLEHLAAKEEERVWLKRQTDGELDDTRLTEGLTGEATVYKRRGMEKPELGRPQIKPKRIRFIFDLSGSMYRFQYDGRLQRSMETAVMLMETFEKLSKKEKYTWDIYGHSGEAPDIPLVLLDKPPTELRDRCKVVEKMYMIPQYAFAGDYTVEAIEKGVTEVAKYDAGRGFRVGNTADIPTVLRSILSTMVDR